MSDLPDEVRARLDQLPDLATTDLTTSLVDDTLTGLHTLRIDQPLATHKIAGHVALPAELLDDTAPGLADHLVALLDRQLRPWRYPDPPAFPTITLFPGLARWQARWHR